MQLESDVGGEVGMVGVEGGEVGEGGGLEQFDAAWVRFVGDVIGALVG